jgi:hypothetical protein
MAVLMRLRVRLPACNNECTGRNAGLQPAAS